MVHPRNLLTPSEIARHLDIYESQHSDDEGDSEVESDDDGLGAGNMSLDDEDGYDDGPEESQEIIVESVEAVSLTPPPPSPGSQDMFLSSPESADTEPHPAHTALQPADIAPQPADTALQPADSENTAPASAVGARRRPPKRPAVVPAPGGPPPQRRRVQPSHPNSGIYFSLFVVIDIKVSVIFRAAYHLAVFVNLNLCQINPKKISLFTCTNYLIILTDFKREKLFLFDLIKVTRKFISHLIF